MRPGWQLSLVVLALLALAAACEDKAELSPAASEQAPTATPSPMPTATPAPTPTPTPTATPAAGAPAEVQALVDAALSGDPEALRPFLDYAAIPCSTAIPVGPGGPPLCREGEADGTLVDVLFLSSCEGGYSRPDELDRTLVTLSDIDFYAVYRMPERFNASPFAAEYVAIFSRIIEGEKEDTQGLAGLLVDEGKLVAVMFGCFQTPEQFVEAWQLEDVVVAPASPPLASPIAPRSPTITLDLLALEFGECGYFSVSGKVLTTSGSISRLTWHWGDGSMTTNQLPASHQYSTNGTYEVEVGAFSSTGDAEAHVTTIAIDITNADDPACKGSVRAHPTTVILRDGKTTEQLRLEIRGPSGELVSPIGREVIYTSSDPSLVQVDASGVVTSTGFGEAEIRVWVEGIARQGTTKVIAGHFRVEPPILLLSVADEPTGALILNVANADGTPVNLAGRNISFFGGNSVASVNGTGMVTAHRPPQSFGETPYIRASVDGNASSNAAVIRVTTNTLGLDMFLLEQSNVAFYIPEQIGDFNYRQVFSDYDIARIINLAYEFEAQLSGLRPFDAALQYLVGEPYPGDSTGPCGLSGNPIRLGADVDNVQFSCLAVTSRPAIPHWAVYLHELGHNFTFASVRFAQFKRGSNVGNSNFIYSEALASIVGLYAAEMMQREAAQYGIPASTVEAVMSQFGHAEETPALSDYIESGSVYSQINVAVLYDMMATIVDNYDGYDTLYRFFSVFLPSDVPLPFNIDSDARQATFFVAAMSAADETNLRPLFREWGFPLDDTYYDQIYPQVEQMVAQRDPAANAGRDRVIPLGQDVVLDDAYVFDWEGDPLTLTWEVVSQPPGSAAFFSDPTGLHPTFSADTVGAYVLTLTAQGGTVAGISDTVTVSVTLTP